MKLKSCNRQQKAPHQMLSTKSLSLRLFHFGLAVVFASGCSPQQGQSHHSSEGATKFSHLDSSQDKFVILNLSGDEKLRAASQSGDTTLDQGTVLSALKNNRCLAPQAAQTLYAQSFTVAAASVRYPELQAYRLELKREMSAREINAVVRHNPCVVSLSTEAELKAYAAPNDPKFSEQAHHFSLQTAKAFDKLYEGENKITKPVVIAVIDSGANLDHPELKDRLFKNAAGKVGYNFVSQNTNPEDDNGHGTHVAGLALAEMNNKTGVAGVAGAHAKLMVLKALDADNIGSVTDTVNAIIYAADNGADIVNLSLGAPFEIPQFQTAIAQAVKKGVVVLAAAGNAGEEISRKHHESPAAYAKDIDGFIAVGSIDAESYDMSSFSNYSDRYVEIAAPGSDGAYGLLSTSLDRNNGYTLLSGTSMATPLVSGAAALIVGYLKTRGQQVTPQLVEAILNRAAVNENRLNGKIKDGQRLDLLALAEYLEDEYGTEAPKPTATPMPDPTATPRPATPTPRPATPTPRPATPTPQPATPTPRPAMPTPRPTSTPRATATPRPATPTPRPATPTPRPATPTPRPATPTPSPEMPTVVQRVEMFMLSQTGALVDGRTISGSASMDLSKGSKYLIYARTDDKKNAVKSVKFELTSRDLFGKVTRQTIVDNQPPFRLGEANFKSFSFAVGRAYGMGNYVLVVTPYSRVNAKGKKGSARRIQIGAFPSALFKSAPKKRAAAAFKKAARR